MGECVRQAGDVDQGVLTRGARPLALRPTFSHFSLDHVRKFSVPRSWHSRSNQMADVLLSLREAPTRPGCSEDEGRRRGQPPKDAALLRVPGISSPTLVPEGERRHPRPELEVASLEIDARHWGKEGSRAM